MPKPRSYKLLCPIARALDRIGDRWTLLILRDLHAGPARFSELQKGLKGIAANLLTDRLAKLVQDGLIAQKPGGHGVSVYALTPLGAQTSDLMFDLALFGARFSPETEVVRPGNLRTVATTLGIAAKRAAEADMQFSTAMDIDGEKMRLVVADGTARLEYGDDTPGDIAFSTSYEALLAFTEGAMPPDVFQREHSKIEADDPEKLTQFSRLTHGILAILQT